MAFMGEISVGETVDASRSQIVVGQFREGTGSSVHAGTTGPVAIILRIFSAIFSLFDAMTDFSVAIMHTPTTEDVFVKLASRENVPKVTVRRLRLHSKA